MKKKTVWLVVSCLMVAALVLASCGPTVTEEEKVVPPSPAEEEEEEVTPLEGKEMVPDSLGRLVEKPEYGGVLNYPLASDILIFDDALGAPYSAVTNNLTNEELLTGDITKGPAGTNEVTWLGTSYFNLRFETGSLAESWEVPDEETIIWHLRKGVHFHDKPPVNGRELVADDVVFCVERLFFESPRSYISLILREKPASVTALDKYTVQVKCVPGEAGRLFEMISEAIWIRPPEMVEKYGDMSDWRNSCGTGPFILTDFVTGSSATLVRNPSYWMKDPLHPENTLPYLDAVKFLIIPDFSTRAAAMRTGKIDYLGDIGLDDAKTLLVSNPELHSIKTLGYGGSIYLIYMRVDKPELPFDDIRVRRALAMAVDNEAIARDFYGEAEILAWPIAHFKEFSHIYIPLEELPQSTRELYEYHPDKARQLLAEAGYPDGFKTEVVCTTTWVDLFSIYKDYWADIGVDLKIDVKESGAYVATIFRKTHNEMMIVVEGIYAPFKLQNMLPGNLSNSSMVDDARINEAHRAIDAAYFDQPKRDQLMKELVPYILEQSWMLQPPLPYQYQVWQPWLKGYHGETAIGTYNTQMLPKWIWLDRDLKEKLTGRR